AMVHKEIEVILTRQLASYLAMPMFIVDPRGNLIFYNEPAEAIIGRRFEESGEMLASEWTTAFRATDEKGAGIPAAAQPPMVAFAERRPVHGRVWITGLDNVRRLIEATCFPLIGQAERYLGAVAITWEVKE